MLEDLKDGHDDARAVSQDAKGLLAAATEDAVDARHAKAVDNVLCEPERDRLGDVESLALTNPINVMKVVERERTYT